MTCELADVPLCCKVLASAGIKRIFGGYTMKLKRLLATGGALGIIISGLIVGSASADPVGCSDATPALLASGSGYMTAYGYGSCSTSETRTFYIEIKWSKALFPDPLVARNSMHATATYYNPSVSSCDHGNTRAYYARSYFGSTASDQHDSAKKTITTCT